MSKRINLGGERARVLRERSEQRAQEDRELFLANWSSELAGKEFRMVPTPAIPVAKAIKDDSGYEYAEYKTLAKVRLPFDCGGKGMPPASRTLPDIIEVTEIVYSGVGVDDQDNESK
jgi:hypothetical protein